MRDEPYRNAAAFRNGVETRIKAEARASSLRSVEQVRRQFLLQRFLVRSSPSRTAVGFSKAAPA